jgi:hypothetical protein
MRISNIINSFIKLMLNLWHITCNNIYQYRNQYQFVITKKITYFAGLNQHIEL